MHTGEDVSAGDYTALLQQVPALRDVMSDLGVGE